MKSRHFNHGEKELRSGTMVLTFLDPATTALVATFLFVFALIFGLLSYAKIFVRRDKEGNPTGEEPKKIYVLLALVFGAFSAMYEPLVLTLRDYLPLASVILVFIFIALFLKRLIDGGKKSDHFDAFPIVISLGILLALIGVFWDRIYAYLPGNFDPANLLWIIGIVIIVGIFYAVQKHKPPPA